MRAEWDDLLLAFLHDPPDKALSIKDHESRTRSYVTEALGWKLSPAETHGGHADHLASAFERRPMPNGREELRRVSAANLHVIHTLSGEPHAAPLGECELEQDFVATTIRDLVNGIEGDGQNRDRFLALWRFLPEKLIAKYPWFAHLPADTRTPDHTTWNHMDITAGLTPPGHGANAAFLPFSVGPVQSFIETAHSVRDLWTGSMRFCG